MVWQLLSRVANKSLVWRREFLEGLKIWLHGGDYSQLDALPFFQRALRKAILVVSGQSNEARIEIPKAVSKEGFYVNAIIRDKKPKPLVPLSLNSDIRSLVIVIQGPIETRDDFTLTTVNVYKAWFPESPIIVSTWDDEDSTVLEELQRAGAMVLLSASSQFEPSESNQNLQMTSTRNGLVRAQEMGSQFVLKTRADQRVNNRFAIPSLPRLLDSFPLSTDGPQRSRLIIPSSGTFAFRPYSASDFLMFGKTDDVLDYWNGFIDSRQRVVPSSTSLRDWSKTRVNEVAFFTNYLETMGETLDFTLSHYWDMLGERFLVVDQGFLDLHWPKYSSIENRWGLWQGSERYLEVSYAMWLLFKSGEIDGDEGFSDKRW